MFSFNSIKGKWTGNEREMGNVLYILIGVDLWLIFYFSRAKIVGGMGNVLESRSFMK